MFLKSKLPPKLISTFRGSFNESIPFLFYLLFTNFLFLTSEAFYLFCNQFRIVKIINLHCFLYIR